MKTIGLIGGLTWYSSIDYYRILNEKINKKLGGDEAAKIIMYSVNYGEIKTLTQAGNWNKISEIISAAARKLEGAGAQFLLIGANTMHNIAEEVQTAINIPLIHIADAVGEAIKNKNLHTVALLGTKYTMQLPFYNEKLASHEIKTIIPDKADVQIINEGVYNELAKGILLPHTKKKYLKIIDKLIQQGAEGVILGCTEIPLLIKQEDCSAPVFDTTLIHCEAAVELALSDENILHT